MGFPEQLKKARLDMRYTQQQVADLMLITRSTYCGYETGKRLPDLTKIQQLTRILHTSSDRLLETEYAASNSKPPNLKSGEALVLFESLRPEFQDHALEQIKKLVELQNKS